MKSWIPENLNGVSIVITEDTGSIKKLYRHLRHTGRRQKRSNIKDKRGAIKGRVGIEKRPEVVINVPELEI